MKTHPHGLENIINNIPIEPKRPDAQRYTGANCIAMLQRLS
jgi:hypothetical protein